MSRSRNLKFSSEVFIKSDEQRTIMEKVTFMRFTAKSELFSSKILQQFNSWENGL